MESVGSLYQDKRLSSQLGRGGLSPDCPAHRSATAILSLVLAAARDLPRLWIRSTKLRQKFYSLLHVLCRFPSRYVDSMVEGMVELLGLHAPGLPSCSPLTLMAVLDPEATWLKAQHSHTNRLRRTTKVCRMTFCAVMQWLLPV